MTPALEPTVIFDYRGAKLCANLLMTQVQGVVALDTETTGCNPKVESPVGKAQLWSMQLAWKDKRTQKLASAFIPSEFYAPFITWLEDAGHRVVVGSSVLSFDRHVLANRGTQVSGFLGCTWQMSRLINNSDSYPDGGGHSLKAWGKRLGYTVTAFEQVVSIPAHSDKIMCYKRDRVAKDITYTAGAEYQKVDFGRKELVPLDKLWHDYPERRKAIVDYAVQDALMSWDVYTHLRQVLCDRKL